MVPLNMYGDGHRMYLMVTRAIHGISANNQPHDTKDFYESVEYFFNKKNPSSQVWTGDTLMSCTIITARYSQVLYQTELSQDIIKQL